MTDDESDLHLVAALVAVEGPFRMKGGDTIEITATEESTAPVKRVVVVDAEGRHGHRGEGHGGLFCVVEGELESFGQLEELATFAAPMATAVGLYANAEVHDPWLVRSWSHNDEGGWFVEERPYRGSIPAPLVQRQLDASTLVGVHDALRRDEQLQLAGSQYVEALRHLHPFSRLRAVSPLYTATEALWPLVKYEQCQSLGLTTDDDCTARKLATALGIDDNREGWRNRVRRQIIGDAVFMGDAEVWKRLAAARHALVHADRNYRNVMHEAESVLNEAGKLIRSAILARLDVDEAVRDELRRFDDWLPDWPPVVQIKGTWASREDQPFFAGLPVTPLMDTNRSVHDGRVSDSLSVRLEGGTSGGHSAVTLNALSTIRPSPDGTHSQEIPEADP